MMFGVGGAARGYGFGFTYGSAAMYNVLADWAPGVFSGNGPSFFEAFFDTDGRGAIPGLHNWELILIRGLQSSGYILSLC